ncbi:MAG: beta-ketoacyl-ACP synthase III, partial [Pseudomonadota bacterium]
MYDAVISSTGLFTPAQTISNDELVASFNRYVHAFNRQHEAAIATGEVEALAESSVEFIEKASGIKQRHVMEKSGVLDIDVMHPLLPERRDDEDSLLCEIGVLAARDALERAHRGAGDIDQVIVACSNLQRAYPAIAIEIQAALGIQGFAYDMNVACSSATFGLQAAISAIQTGVARAALVVNPEVCSAHLNFRDRDSHFIFGDVSTALVVERAEEARSDSAFRVRDIALKTHFSNNIRNNFGFLNRCAPGSADAPDKLFRQQGRKV